MSQSRKRNYNNINKLDEHFLCIFRMSNDLEIDVNKYSYLFSIRVEWACNNNLGSSDIIFQTITNIFNNQNNNILNTTRRMKM